MSIKQAYPSDGIPMMQCDNCDVFFSVIWNLNPVYDKPGFCPFCGDEAEYEYEEQESDNGPRSKDKDSVALGNTLRETLP